MKYLVTKDKKKRICLQKIELKLMVLKTIFKNKNYFFSLRYSALIKCFYLTTKKSFKTQIVNRCVFTGRSKGILSKFKISRLMFLRLGRAGDILGLRKHLI